MTASTGLAPEWYSKGEPFMKEKTGIFAKRWLPLAPLAALGKRGDFASATIGGWPLVAVHGNAGVRGFRNTCRHQNMMVVEQPAGNVEVLRCRYHGWTYGLDGRFREAPPLMAPADPSSEANDLAALPTTEWAGIAMVNLDPDAAAFEPPAGADALLAGAPTAFAGAVTTDIACNWKVVAEMRLADPHADGESGRAFGFPIVCVRRTAGGVVIEQIMARSFLRTRLVAFAFGDALAWAQADAAATKARAEVLEKLRDEGAADPMIALPAVQALHETVRAAAAG